MESLKFRAWHKSWEVMDKVISIDWDHDMVQLQDEIGNCDWVDVESVDIMQYIGLKDVDGKNIWENDIVQVYYVHTSDSPGMRVKAGDKSEQGYPTLVRKDEDGTRFWPFIDGCGGCISYAMKAINHAKGYGSDEYGYYIVKVLGNRFENPELLERKNG